MTEKRTKKTLINELSDGIKQIAKIQEALRLMNTRYATRDNIINFCIETVKGVYTVDGELDNEQLLKDASAFIQNKEAKDKIGEIPELDL